MANYEGYEVTKIEKSLETKVAVVTLNEPEHRNPLNSLALTELADIFEEIDEDEEINAVVLTGAGKCFCGGGDIRQLSHIVKGQAFDRLEARFALRTFFNIQDCIKPVIAAVQGDAVGGGANIALHCDIVIMAEDAHLQELHVPMGLVAGDGGILWPLQIGLNKAKELVLTGEAITGIEAERIGLVNHAVPRGKVLPTALAMAEKLASGPIQAISWTKQIMNKLAHQHRELLTELALSREALLSVMSEDHKEAVNAFLEKRPRRYKSKFMGTNVFPRRHLPAGHKISKYGVRED